MIAEAIETDSKNRKVTVVCHDFGCAWLFMLQKAYPQLISRVCLLDIGGTAKTTCGDGLVNFTYRWFIILLWFMGEPLGGFVYRLMGDSLSRPKKDLRPQMGYPYWYALSRNLNIQDWQPDTTKMPIFFCYGNKKSWYFHDQEWIDFLTANEENGCKIKEYDCGHWIN